jgi:hypothetical protein
MMSNLTNTKKVIKFSEFKELLFQKAVGRERTESAADTIIWMSVNRSSIDWSDGVKSHIFHHRRNAGTSNFQKVINDLIPEESGVDVLEIVNDNDGN